ncbi:hypothetical protein ACSLMH_05625 [Flavobacterium columnare]|uniref:hypothetical protein n=1 Tax=Flavobacterium columnare TaxID=996 RepID=UPI0007F98B63|nr:hypothetical protein [Flavobacterium columnare]ANO48128.1 hypothetical protein Pf1_02674 [Flavobacterium columnare]APT21302.1 hypothetical protein BU993_00825 [Flavobacterium columnare]
MSQKICVISFDHWNYDCHIVTELQKLGHESHHIRIGNLKYKNFLERLANTCSKVFLGKNPKIKKRQEYILSTLKQLGKQDQILVINPELIELEYHLEIKKFTNKYLAYLYDSIERNPIDHLPSNIFDKIYSFDIKNCKEHCFVKTSNYIYTVENKSAENITQNFIYIGSIDERIDLLNQIGEILKRKKLSFSFYSIGKKSWIYNFKKRCLGRYPNIIFKRKRFSQSETLNLYKQSSVIIDIIRKNQSGLSFRIFEALGLNKKIITNNPSIQKYDLIKINSIFHLNDLNELDNIEDFLNSDTKIDKSIMKQYKLTNWVQKIFSL